MRYIRKQVLKATQARMAEIVDATQATVSRWEAGELHPDRKQMSFIRAEAARLGMRWDDCWFFEVPTSSIPADLEQEGEATAA